MISPNSLANLRPNRKGRPKGCLNQFTTLKNMFINALQRVGGEDKVVEFANKDFGQFLGYIARMLPTNIKHEGEITERIINVNYKKESK